MKKVFIIVTHESNNFILATIEGGENDGVITPLFYKSVEEFLEKFGLFFKMDKSISETNDLERMLMIVGVNKCKLAHDILLTLQPKYFEHKYDEGDSGQFIADILTKPNVGASVLTINTHQIPLATVGDLSDLELKEIDVSTIFRQNIKESIKQIFNLSEEEFEGYMLTKRQEQFN